MYVRTDWQQEVADIMPHLLAPVTPSCLPGTSYPPGRPANTPLETLRARWQSAAEALCAQHGLNLSLLGVLATEIVQADGAAELPTGVQHFSQVQDWVATTAAQAQRKV